MERPLAGGSLSYVPWPGKSGDRVKADEKTVTEAAEGFGYSRPSFYQSQVAFAEEGLSGLVPKKRGPRGGHKITEEVLKFMEECIEKDHALGSHAC